MTWWMWLLAYAVSVVVASGFMAGVLHRGGDSVGDGVRALVFLALLWPAVLLGFIGHEVAQRIGRKA